MSDIKWGTFDIEEDLRKSGLLWAINRFILHEFSLALAVDAEGGLSLAYGWDDFPPETNIEGRERLAAWTTRRLEEFRETE